MYKKVIFRDRQELQAEDLNNVELFTDQTFDVITTDAISDSVHYTGFQVSQQGTIEIRVEPGRLYKNGKIYISEQAQDFNLFQYLPLTTKKVCAVVVWGSEVESEVEPRDFLIDVVQGTTEPRAVAMQRIRLANINIVPGVESADPQPPALQEGIVPVAYVLLNTTGIERIERVYDYILPRLKEIKADLIELQTWKNLTEPKISGIITDLTALSKKSDRKADLKQVLEIAADMARIKEKLNLPSTYHSYDADYFGNTEKIDIDNTTAKIENGILFPDAGRSLANLALFNPYDPNIKRFDNLVLPDFNHVPKIKTEGYSGDISISQYQWQTHEVRKYTIYTWQWVYGWRWNWYWNWYYRHWYRYYGHYYWWYGYWGYWVKVPQIEYKLETTTHTINGAIVAQTFLVSSAFYLTSLGLFFTQTDSNAPINIVICETVNGKPDLQKTLTIITVQPSDVKKYPHETQINISPVYLKPGRYAICFITQGNYRVATVSGQNYLQGTLFFGTDGDYFVGDLTKDIMFTLYGAQFKQARTEIQLQPVSLSGGITDLTIETPAVVPEGTQLIYEINVGGRWYPITEVGRLNSKPDLVPIRAVMLGTADLQPALFLSEQAIIASRPTTTFTAVSTQRTLSAPRTTIEVQLLVAEFDSTKHTISCQLIAGTNTIDPAVVSQIQEDQDTIRFTYTFNFTDGIDSYKIKIQGTRTEDSKPFVVVERIDIAY
ncbi:MAG: hypothetical protein QW228_06325 [Candidatus Aenigmatarchaeota archaeon]